MGMLLPFRGSIAGGSASCPLHARDEHGIQHGPVAGAVGEVLKCEHPAGNHFLVRLTRVNAAGPHGVPSLQRRRHEPEGRKPMASGVSAQDVTGLRNKAKPGCWETCLPLLLVAV